MVYKKKCQFSKMGSRTRPRVKGDPKKLKKLRKDKEKRLKEWKNWWG